MASSGPNVKHHFTGNNRSLPPERRAEVCKALIALQQAFSQSVGQPAHLKAEIRLLTNQDKDKEDVYTVTVTDSWFDVTALPPPKASVQPSTLFVHPSPSAGHGGDPQTLARRSIDIHDANEMPPSKRPRSGPKDDPLHSDEHDATTSDSTTDQALTFMKNWHREWKQQGGWLFDTLNRAGTKSDQTMTALENRLAATQDVLGQSINAANASNVSEFEKVKGLIPWLEQCRKVNADSVQAREEKWRSSSATFHDQSRRDREAAEKRIEAKLDAQTSLLTRIVKAGGINMDSFEDGEEGSLEAQLTAELNLEVAQAEKHRDRSFLSIDGDDGR